MPIHDRLIAYAAAIRADLRANAGAGADGAARELLLASRARALLEAAVADTHPEGPQVLAEYNLGGVGRPDLAFKRPGQPARAFVELKVPEHPLTPAGLSAHDRAQHRRFSALPLWALCNFHTIRLLERAEVRLEAALVPASALEPTTADAAAAQRIAAHDPAPFLAILERLVLAQPPQIASAQDAARALAFAARLAREVVADTGEAALPPALVQVRQEFEQTLFARPKASGREGDSHALFADAFAQTLAFGLLLAREAAGGAEIDRFGWQHLPDGSLLRATLFALTSDQVLHALGSAFDVLLDTANAIPPETLAPGADGRDPILYFYEDFLATYDPQARQRYGVYYTPPELVEFIVSRTEAALAEGLGKPGGLRDPAVQVLDPACGTGTFPVAALRRAAEAAEREVGPGAVPAAVSGLAARFGAFELLVGPYTIAHWRVAREVAAGGGAAPARLPIWLADTLAPADGTPLAPAVLGFLANPMVEERQGADALKSAAPILAVLGNPPYRRLRRSRNEIAELVGPWMDGLWDDLKRPVRDAGAGRSLNAFPDLYIAFWRWALWRLFEAPGAQGRGVVSFVTNRGFLAGRAFGGLRQELRRRFDVIEVLDLRGDSRGALPEHADGQDENVFNIQTGVCVTTAWASGTTPPGREGELRYADIWDVGAFDRRAKLAALRGAARGEGAPVPWRAVAEQPGMGDLKPEGFREQGWPSLAEVFSWSSNGLVTYRDGFAYDTRRDRLEARIRRFGGLGAVAAEREFKNTRGRKWPAAQARPLEQSALEQVTYRPLDRRWLYNRREFIDFPKAELQALFDAPGGNVALHALGDGTGSGPAVWCHGIKPDQHAFRGSYGGWVFPLRQPAAGPGGHLLNPALLQGLALAHAAGPHPEPQAVFDAVLALLSAPSYARRFPRDLEDRLPHVPFPADAALFAEAVALGARIRALETFAAAPDQRFRTARLEGAPAAGLPLQVGGPAASWTPAPDGATGAVALQAGGTLRLAQVPATAWAFEVSGYRVLHGWLKGRNGDPWDEALQAGLLDLTARIAHLLALFAEADALLGRCLAVGPLDRRRLGLPSPPRFGEPGGAAAVADAGGDEEEAEEP